MADFDDYSLTRNTSTAAPPVRPVPSGPPLWPIAAVAVLGLGLGALWFFAFHSKPQPAPRAVAQTTVDLPHPPVRRAEPGEAIDLPPLDETDALVRTLVAKLSSHPVAAAWLTTQGLIRNLTVVVANIADGETPAKHLVPVAPKGTFATKTSGGVSWIDPASYHRYDGIAAAVEGLDARGVARFYATIKPRIQDANKELAGRDTNFDQTVERAIVMLLRTPVLDENVQVKTGKVMYVFANEGYEELPAVQRQFIRMGPANMRIVKAKLREVAGYLGIPDSALPRPDGP